MAQLTYGDSMYRRERQPEGGSQRPNYSLQCQATLVCGARTWLVETIHWAPSRVKQSPLRYVEWNQRSSRFPMRAAINQHAKLPSFLRLRILMKYSVTLLAG